MKRRQQRVTIPFIVQNLDERGSHIFIKVKWKRRIALALLDTGATHSVFDSSLFDKKDEINDSDVNHAIGINAQEMKTQIAKVKHLSIENLKISEFVATFIGLSDVNNIYIELGLRPFQLILGSDFLFAHAAIINYKKKTLSLLL